MRAIRELRLLVFLPLFATSPTLYIVGCDDLNHATLWITDQDGTLIQNSPITLGGGSALGLTTLGSNLYIAGTSISNALLWITDKDGIKTSSSPITLDSGSALGASF